MLLRIVTGVLALGVLAGSAIAQEELKPEAPIGSRIKRAPDQYSAATTQLILRDFASCVVHKRRALASVYLLDRSTLSSAKYDRLFDPDCLGESVADIGNEVELKLGGDAMRFALAEELLASELDRIDPAQLTKAAPLAIPTVAESSYRQASADDREKSMASDRATIVWYKFGECAVRADPAAARTVLRSAPNSPDEAAAIQAMMPTFGSCVEKGAQIALNRSSLRGALALAYYSLAHAPAAGASRPVLSQR